MPTDSPCAKWSLEEEHDAHQWDAPVDGQVNCPGWGPPAEHGSQAPGETAGARVMSASAVVAHHKAVTEVRKVHEIQGRDGNWNYSPYMLGTYNGLELALSILEGERDPQYRDEPAGGYLCDASSPEAAGSSADPLE